MASRITSIRLLVAEDDEGRHSAAALAASIDPSISFGAQLRQVLDDLANGEEVMVVRSDRELTPAGAAEVLGVTRQFVDRLLADGTLEFRRLPGSSHRRVRLKDVLALAEERERRRQGAEAIRAALG